MINLDAIASLLEGVVVADVVVLGGVPSFEQASAWVKRKLLEDRYIDEDDWVTAGVLTAEGRRLVIVERRR